MIAFGTKAETLERLAPVLTTAAVLPQLRFTVDKWRRDRAAVIQDLTPWLEQSLVVRSSALTEDRAGASMAGRFASVLNVSGAAALASAIDTVVDSFESGGANQVFVQPMLNDVAMSGVGFTRDGNTGSPYVVLNYDASTGRTDTVTSGHGRDTRTFYAFEGRDPRPGHPLEPVLALARELQCLLACASLDFEFAITKDGRPFLLQARPLSLAHQGRVTSLEIADALGRIERKVIDGQRRHPYLFGSRTVYGVMPDWNPAEIIGVRPKPLALSLYKDVITDSVWAYQRNNYGYRNLRSFPLMLSLGGQPFIDVRVSFNSFLPADVSPELSERLVNYYIDSLVAVPSHHDKVEFEIVYSCYTLDLPERMMRLAAHGFSDDDRKALSESLRTLTNTIIHPDTGLWLKDIDRIRQLESRRQQVADGVVDPIARIYWLIEDCKRYGTLPFVGLARAAFIAVQLLRSLVHTGVLSADDHRRFMSGLSTVGSRLTRDFRVLGRDQFLALYGHLRPGTYDIQSARYDEAPDRYFDWGRAEPPPESDPPFAISIEQLNRTSRLLAEHHLGHDAVGLFNFIKAAIEGREYAKFIFTQSLSDALRLLKQTGLSHGLSEDDCAYIDYSSIQQLYASSADAGDVLRRSVEVGRNAHAVTRQIVLPPLVADPSDVWTFEVPPSEPNFITAGVAEGTVAFAHSARPELAGSILMIPSADPGFDWIFAHSIRGFITMWGGANSHMAVRAAELGIPAVIGAGEALFESWARARVLSIDCAGRQVRILQ